MPHCKLRLIEQTAPTIPLPRHSAAVQKLFQGERGKLGKESWLALFKSWDVIRDVLSPVLV